MSSQQENQIFLEFDCANSEILFFRKLKPETGNRSLTALVALKNDSLLCGISEGKVLVMNEEFVISKEFAVFGPSGETP